MATGVADIAYSGRHEPADCAARPRLPAPRPAGNAGERRGPAAVRPAAGPLGLEHGPPGRARVPHRPARHAIRQHSRPRGAGPAPLAPRPARRPAPARTARDAGRAGRSRATVRTGGTAARDAARPLAAAVQRARHRRARVGATRPLSQVAPRVLGRSLRARTHLRPAAYRARPDPAAVFRRAATGSAAGRPPGRRARHRRESARDGHAGVGSPRAVRQAGSPRPRRAGHRAAGGQPAIRRAAHAVQRPVDGRAILRLLQPAARGHATGGARVRRDAQRRCTGGRRCGCRALPRLARRAPAGSPGGDVSRVAACARRPGGHDQGGHAVRAVGPPALGRAATAAPGRGAHPGCQARVRRAVARGGARLRTAGVQPVARVARPRARRDHAPGDQPRGLQRGRRDWHPLPRRVPAGGRVPGVDARRPHRAQRHRAVGRWPHGLRHRGECRGAGRWLQAVAGVRGRIPAARASPSALASRPCAPSGIRRRASHRATCACPPPSGRSPTPCAGRSRAPRGA